MQTSSPKKIGVLTYHYVINYGAILQALGTLKALQCLGYEAELIDYIPRYDRLSHRFMFGGSGGLRDGHIFSAIQMQRRFKSFLRQYMPLSRHYSSIEAVAHETFRYFAYMTGSDQVWNCKRFSDAKIKAAYDPIYFLDFPKQQTMHISYASCFGRSDQPEETLPMIRRSLQAFDALAVRNIFSQKLVECVVERKATLVVDPVFLVDFDRETTTYQEKEPYMLIYSVNRGAMNRHMDTVREIAQHLGLRMIAVTRTTLPGVDEHRRNLSPSDWLGLFQGASYVCTDSFHGAAFSLKYQKPFTAFPKPGWSSMRILDLLQRYGLSHRAVTPESPTVSTTPIDWYAVTAALKVDIRASYSYLLSALQKKNVAATLQQEDVAS